MRTTLDIDDDVMTEAKARAHFTGQSLGRTISELVRKGLTRPEPKIELKNGVPVWISPPGSITITGEMVRRALDEEFEHPAE